MSTHSQTYKRDARCKYYNNDGTPRVTGGCQTLGKCNFVHPSETGRWEHARPSIFIPSLSTVAVNSPVLGPSIAASVFECSPASTSHTSGSSALRSSLAKKHFVSGGFLGMRAENTVNVEASSVESATAPSPSSPSPSLLDFDDGVEDMDISDDDLATPAPESVPERHQEASIYGGRTGQTPGVRNLADLESGSRSFIKQMIDGVYLLEDLQATKKRLDSLRRMEHSHLYAHPSASLRKQFSTTRRESENHRTLLEKKFASRNKKLSQLPAPERLVLNLEAEWQVRNEALGGYLDGAEKWLDSIQQQIHSAILHLQELHRSLRVRQQNRLEGEPKYIPPALEASYDRLCEVRLQVQEFIQATSQLPEDYLETMLLSLWDEKEGALSDARELGLQRAVDRAVLGRLNGFKQDNEKLDMGIRECDALIAASIETFMDHTPTDSKPKRMDVVHLRQQIEEQRRTAGESREAARKAIAGVHLVPDTLATSTQPAQLQPHIEQRVREHVDRAMEVMESRCADRAYSELVRTVSELMLPNLAVARYVEYRRIEADGV